MDVRRLQRCIDVFTYVSICMSGIVCVFWLLAVFTKCLEPSHDSGELDADAFRAVADAQATSVQWADVSKATLGQAMFRTNRTVSEKVVDELGRYEFRGMSIRAGQARAYIKDTSRKKNLTKVVGDLIGTYEILEIDKSGVKLRKGNEELRLSK